MREAEQCGWSSQGFALHCIRRTQELFLERLTALVEREYESERERITRSPDEGHKLEIVRKLLSGELTDPAGLLELEYEIHNSWHLGLIASGAGADEFLQKVRTSTHRKLLVVLFGGTWWGWLGGQKMSTVADNQRVLADVGTELSLSVGEPGNGIDGWRLTHDQALDALPVALLSPEKSVQYADCRLLAAALSNATLAKSLKQTYLTPLGDQKDRGAILRRTLRTYIDVECNATSASYALKVGRHTVKNRVLAAEGLIGMPLHKCLAELHVALHLEQLEQSND